MFQNAAIDVAIALSLMYLMLSLFCTVINEYIATKFKLRARSLAQALAKFLDDDTLRATFYRHGLIVTNKSATATGLQSAPGVTTMTNAAASGASAIASGVRMLMRAAPSRRRAASTRPPARAAVATATAPAPEQDHPSYLSSRSVALALIGSLDTTKPLPGIEDIRTAVMKLPKETFAPRSPRSALRWPRSSCPPPAPATSIGPRSAPGSRRPRASSARCRSDGIAAASTARIPATTSCRRSRDSLVITRTARGSTAVP